MRLPKRHRFSIALLIPVLALIFVALMAPLLSNNKPIVAIDDQGIQFPIWSDDPVLSYPIDKSHYKWALHPPIPYAPGDIDLDNSGVSPFSKPAEHPWYHTHWLGTDEIGRDVLAHLIHGCRSSVIIALGAMIIALVIGLLLGAVGGYWHGRLLRLSWVQLLLMVAVVVYVVNAVWTISVQFNSFVSVILCSLLVAIAVVVLRFTAQFENRLFGKYNRSNWLRSGIRYSPDLLVRGLLNFFTAIPGYFALLAMLALWSKPNAASLSVVLGLLMWPDLTRLTRSGVIQMRQTKMAESALSLGYSPARIMFFHLLPNALQPALVALSFGLGGAIMAESFLAFIGIAPAEMISWGTLLAKSRTYPEMWWLSVFPGLAILFAILTFYRLSGNKLT